MIAIAITLLVLEISVPSPRAPGTLAHKLAEQWPSYAAYSVSFITIGIIWVNHHTVMGHIARVDRLFLFLNVLFLMLVAFNRIASWTVCSYAGAKPGSRLIARLNVLSVEAGGAPSGGGEWNRVSPSPSHTSGSPG